MAHDRVKTCAEESQALTRAQRKLMSQPQQQLNEDQPQQETTDRDEEEEIEQKQSVQEEPSKIGNLWHRRLGHCGNYRLLELLKHSKDLPFNRKDLEQREQNCTGCIVGKFRRLTRGKSETQHEVLSVFAVDLTGPITPASWDGKKYTMGVYELGKKG